LWESTGSILFKFRIKYWLVIVFQQAFFSTISAGIDMEGKKMKKEMGECGSKLACAVCGLTVSSGRAPA
jgi:hypothetical protein